MSNANEPVNYRYGIRNCKIALQLAPGSYGSAWHEKGIETLTESRPTNDPHTFYSDDGERQSVPVSGENDTFQITDAEFSRRWNTDIMGHEIDAATGAIVKSKEDVAATFACGYEVQGTQGGTRIWKLGCTSSEPVASAHQTNDSGITEAPQSCTVTVNGDTFGGKSKYEMVCHEGDPGYETFLDAVPVSGAAAADVTLAALDLDGVSLTPSFRAKTTSYTAATSAASATVTATPSDADADVTILVDGTEVASGGTASFNAGTNILTVVVANGGAAMAYTVLVTRVTE